MTVIYIQKEHETFTGVTERLIMAASSISDELLVHN